MAPIKTGHASGYLNMQCACLKGYVDNRSKDNREIINSLNTSLTLGLELFYHFRQPSPQPKIALNPVIFSECTDTGAIEWQIIRENN